MMRDLITIRTISIFGSRIDKEAPNVHSKSRIQDFSSDLLCPHNDGSHSLRPDSSRGPSAQDLVVPRESTPPQPRAGDAIRTGPEGEVVIEWRNDSGESQQRRIQRRNRVAPVIVSEINFAGEGRVRYSYTVANGPAARQDIGLFALGVSRPDLMTNLSGPENWTGGGTTPDVPRCYWYSKKMASYIKPGQGTGPFRYEVPMLPGFVDAYFQGYLSEQEASSGADELDLSPWLLNQIHEALRFENNSARIKIVGPKIEISPTLNRGQLAEAIAEEMLAASRMPEFEKHRSFLEETSSTLKDTHRAASEIRRRISQMGETVLQQSFFRAMAFNLEYMEKLP
jgi:hypothetical protein